jgi:protein O-mannosyl-transferase
MKLPEDTKFIVIIIAVCLLVFANSLYGDFVYDDLRQILRNPLIQDNSLIWKALTSDVWAFKGDGKFTASNYWRPTFTAFNIICFRFFGTNPFGWHLFNVLLHAGVCVLAFALLRLWKVSAVLAFVITLIFAVHPVHTESVAWIAGSPDLLFALAFIGSLWFAEKQKLWLALTLFAFALGAKEAAIVCFPIYFLIYNRNFDKNQSINKTLPFVAIAIGYFLLRWLVLGVIAFPREDSPNVLNAILSIPVMFTFYLSQTVFPNELGANYPLRPVESISLVYFILPLIVSTAALIGLYLSAKRSFIQKIGLALFLLPLIPAMNATAFPSEQIVHDRYLYLPLLGYLMLILPIVAEQCDKFNKHLFLAAAVVLSLLLSFQTFSYNKVWQTDFSLWENAVKIDETSSANWNQYGTFLLLKNKNSEAVAAFSRSIEIKESQNAFNGRARAFITLKKLAEAEKDALKAVELGNIDGEIYSLYQSQEILAITYLEQRKYDDAIKSLIESRKKLPIYYAAITEKLAIAYYQSGKKDDALRELESAKTQSRRELLPESKNVFLRLGMLYSEIGKNNEAKEALQEYLKLSQNNRDANTEQDRQQASKILQNLK